MTVFTEIAAGLEFPEGPIALADGSVLVVEVLGHRLSRVLPDGAIETVAEFRAVPMGRRSGPTAPSTCATTADGCSSSKSTVSA